MKRAFAAVLILALVAAMAGCSPAYQTLDQEQLNAIAAQFFDLANGLGYEYVTARDAATPATATAMTVGAPAAATLSQSRWAGGGYWSGPDSEGWYTFFGGCSLPYYSQFCPVVPNVLRFRAIAAGQIEVAGDFYSGITVKDILKASYTISASGKVSGSIAVSVSLSQFTSGEISATARVIDSSLALEAIIDFNDLTAVAIKDPEAQTSIGDNLFVGSADFHGMSNFAGVTFAETHVAHLAVSVTTKGDGVQYLEFGTGSWYDNPTDDPDAGLADVAGASKAVAM